MSQQSAEGSAPVRRILIVDDDRMVLRIVRDFFSPHGFVVDEARDGVEALRRLEESVPDIIVADILMPRLDGWDLFEAVRRRPGTERVPFIFLTTERGLAERLRGFHVGADDYVTKPFDVEELLARVERVLSWRSGPGAVSPEHDVILAGVVQRSMPLTDLLQILALNGQDVRVELSEERARGTILLVDGNIVHAACGSVSGVKALYRMLGWIGARFQVLPRRDEAFPRTVEEPTTSLLMHALVSLDEWNRWSGMLPGRSAVLRVAPEGEKALVGRPLAPAEEDVLARAREGAAVEEILETSALPDSDLAEAMCTLLGSGVLQARP